LEKIPRILLVDDDAGIRSSFKAILQDEGYTVDAAASGQEAIAKAEEVSYDVAILDIHLPDIDGVELLKLMKEPVPRTRKIMVTGYPSLKNAISSLNNRADFYLLKPIDVQILLTVVKEQLAQRERELRVCEEKAAEKLATLEIEASVQLPELVDTENPLK
jgi:DNA-binding NtrC family response regulator